MRRKTSDNLPCIRHYLPILKHKDANENAKAYLPFTPKLTFPDHLTETAWKHRLPIVSVPFALPEQLPTIIRGVLRLVEQLLVIRLPILRHGTHAVEVMADGLCARVG